MGNISKQKREDLIAKIKEIRRFISGPEQNENTGNLLTYLGELEKDVKGKKYGLIFEEHREAVDDLLDSHVPVLAEEENLFINNGGQINFLIEGDNLAALRLLLKTHRGKIDLIYIDPPYNTGSNDFMYDDSYVGEDDGYRHSKWMSFMQRRFDIAKQLMSPEGVIFIQISDIELAQLKNLCDSTFREENFLNIISVNMKNIAGASGGGEDKRFKKNCEYILVYAKNYSKLPIFNGAYEYTEMSELIQEYIDNGASWKYTSVLVDPGERIFVGATIDGDGSHIRVYKRINPTIKSIKQVATADGISEKEAYKKYGTKIFQTTNAQSSIRTRVINYRSEQGITDDLVSIEYIPKTGRNKGHVYEQFYKGGKCRLLVWLSDTSEVIDDVLYKKELQGTYWDYTPYMKNVNKEAGVDFSNGKKPVALMQRIISLYPRKDFTVLDYFAGSGSTGHAVIIQNQEDKGTRRFILCTNNQNNICREKTYTRLRNVISGYTNDKGKHFPSSAETLKYYRIEFVPITERLYYEYADELLLHIRELVELENGVNFLGNTEIVIVLTDDEFADIVANIGAFKKCRKLYLGHNVLPTGKQQDALKKAHIVVNVIPNYYYSELEV
jgi:adenine-specific DNA-methyltransferase